METYSKATAPLRKFMAVVAGTPSIEVPRARVSMTLLPSVTRTMADRNWYCVMVWRTMVAIDAAEVSFTAAPAPVEVATEIGVTPNAQALSATDAIAMPRHHGVLRSSCPVTSTSAQPREPVSQAANSRRRSRGKHGSPGS